MLRYVEMRSFERKTYMNLIAGPTKERIRLHDERNRAHQHHGGDDDG